MVRILVCILVITQAGCLSRQTVSLKASAPRVNAVVLADGREAARCETPCALDIPRADRTVLLFERAGLRPEAFVLSLVPADDRPEFFSHWVYFIPPIIFMRGIQYLIQLSRGAYSRLDGFPETVEMIPEEQ
jgi:hypothetical protein